MFSSRLYLFSSIAVILAVVNGLPSPASRDPTTGRKVNSTSSANNTANRSSDATVNNIPINGTQGAQAACNRGFTLWCKTVGRRSDENERVLVDEAFEALAENGIAVDDNGVDVDIDALD